MLYLARAEGLETSRGSSAEQIRARAGQLTGPLVMEYAELLQELGRPQEAVESCSRMREMIMPGI